MALNFSGAYDAYARHSVAARASFTREPNFSGRFLLPGDDHAHSFAVPSPAHVARFLIAPALEAANVNDPSTARHYALDALERLPRKYDGGNGYRAPRFGQEHLETPTPLLRLADYYRGLYAALNFAYDFAHEDNAGRPFDRGAYIEAIADAAVAELLRNAEQARSDAARKQRQTEAQARHTHARTTPTITPAERSRRWRAQRAESALLEREKATSDELSRVHEALATILAASAQGDVFTRRTLAAAVSATLGPGTPRILPRRLVSYLIELAPEFGLVERWVTFQGTRGRGFVVPAPAITLQKETPVNAEDIRDLADAYRELGDARAYAADELERELVSFERQRDLLASRDIRGALGVHAKRHGGSNVVDATHRFTKAS